MPPVAERAIDSSDRLGECPLWDERAQALWWVDIHAPALKRWRERRLDVYALPEATGSFALCRDDSLLVALRSGLQRWEAGGFRPFAAPEKPEALRFNDGRCDRNGRFWVGTLEEPGFPSHGGLYRIDPDGTHSMHRSGIQVPNSLAFSPEGCTMYFADSPRHKIWSFDYDGATGRYANERLFATPYPGFPDGSCVDADGCLWNAEWGAGRVVRYTPKGKIDRILEVPAKNPTCCCFGGALLDTLYITTADRAGVFAAVPGVKGLPEARFGKPDGR